MEMVIELKDSDETIDKLLEGIEFISTITFTGESSQAVDRIRYFTKAIKARGIELGGFNVATNNGKASMELVHALLDLYTYVHPSDPKDQNCNETDLAQALMDLCAYVRPRNRKDTCKFFVGWGASEEAVILYSGLSFSVLP